MRPPVLDFARTDEELQEDCRRLRTFFRGSLSPVLAIRNHGVDFRGAARRKAAELEAERGAATENRNVEFASADGADNESGVGNAEEDLVFRAKVEALSYRCARVLSGGSLTKEALKESGLSLGGRLTLRHYPLGGNGELGAHVDGNLFTLLWSDRPGLEVLNPIVGVIGGCQWKDTSPVRHSRPALKMLVDLSLTGSGSKTKGQGRRAVWPSDVLAMGLPTISAVSEEGEETAPLVLREEDWILVGNGIVRSRDGGDDTAPPTTASDDESKHDERDLLLTPGLGWYRGSDGGVLQRELPVACPVLHRVRVPRDEGGKHEERFSLPFLARVLKPF